MVFIIADLIKWLLFQTDTAPAHCPSLLQALAKTLYFIAEANFSKKAINFPITAHNKIWWTYKLHVSLHLNFLDATFQIFSIPSYLELQQKISSYTDSHL